MLDLRQTQKLSPVLTQQLQQAIKLLQLSQLELLEAIEEELKENPILEITEKETRGEQAGEATGETAEETTGETAEGASEDSGDVSEWLERYSPSEEYGEREDRERPDYENMAKTTYSLRDYLRWQIAMSDFGPDERIVAEWIIGNIDDNGYLAYPISEIAGISGFTPEVLEGVLKKVQMLDPPGVGARNLKECILLQYHAKGVRDPAFEEIVGSHFELLEKNNAKDIARKTGYPIEKVKEVLEKIQDYDPKPGTSLGDDYMISYAVPDVFVVKGEDGFEVSLNDEEIPELRMSKYYIGLYTSKSVNGDAKRYIKNKVKQAEWFIKSLKQRQRTLYLVAVSIVNYQREFFEKGLRFLRPLVLKEIAQDVGVHESTVSRITTSKYMSTPQGIFEMKFFFPTGINNTEGDSLSTNVVMDLISEAVKKEDKKNPLTDEEIVSLLKGQHSIAIARRTIAKYRDILHIGSSRERAEAD